MTDDADAMLRSRSRATPAVRRSELIADAQDRLAPMLRSKNREAVKAAAEFLATLTKEIESGAHDGELDMRRRIEINPADMPREPGR